MFRQKNLLRGFLWGRSNYISISWRQWMSYWCGKGVWRDSLSENTTEKKII